MSEKTETIAIWPPETGITDYETPWEELSASEIQSIKDIWADQQARLAGTKQLTEFSDKLSREWAIETGIIENLYQIDRGVTETLIERGFQAELLTHGSINKPAGYVISILNDQRNALEGLFDFITSKRPLSTSYIKELHAALVRSQDTTEGQNSNGNLIEIPLLKGEWKSQPNHPTRDGVIYAYCPPEHVASEMDRLIRLHEAHITDGVSPEVEAAWLHHRFSQIHPFQDGNGRVCRALASLVLIRAGLFPLVVTRDDKNRYLDALEAADKGDLQALVDVFVYLQRAQFRKATALSENLLTTRNDVESAMKGLLEAAKKTREDREEEQRRVFDYARDLQSDTVNYLEGLVPDLKNILTNVSRNGTAFVNESNENTDHYYRGQIIENARDHLDYYADFHAYRSWITLNFVWERRGRLVFSFHGIGRPFTGSLVCAPFFEIRDNDDESQTHASIIPVTDEAFVFFHNEDIEKVRSRFSKWREQVVTVSLKELTENL